ncbi:MAG: amidase [Gammaproteobacteria bacterium]|nr:amidase [Gammaproteobacteria bacterium]
MRRRDFLGATLFGSAAAALPLTAGHALAEIPLAELLDGMQAGRWTARQLVDQYLARIDAIDRNGPCLNAVIEINPEATAIADELDGELRAGRRRGPLHGIPVLIKDNIDTGDRMQTTAGSLALAGSTAPHDAFIVARLRAAGAVLLGKTNLSEWANFRSASSSSGWSARGGQTRSPYVLDRNPSGSSSGSATAAAASLAALAVGTETDGSIISPSSAGGLVGIKPTVGLWSRAGIIPISHSQDTAGPMCRTVADAAMLLGALTGVDEHDPATLASRGHALSDYRPYLRADGLRGARLGVMRRHMNISAKVERVYDEALRALAAAGAVLIDPVDLPDPTAMGEAEWDLLAYEFKAGIAAYLRSRSATTAHRTLADLIAFNVANAEREMPWFGQDIFEYAQKSESLASPKYQRLHARCRRLARERGLDPSFARYRLDALVAVAGGPAWPIDLVNGDRYTGGGGSYAAVAGYPAITVPAGDLHGLPIGLLFMGRPWSEGRLIELAFAFEQATRARRPPGFRRSVA